jgi:hypothetical protein
MLQSNLGLHGEASGNYELIFVQFRHQFLYIIFPNRLIRVSTDSGYIEMYTYITSKFRSVAMFHMPGSGDSLVIGIKSISKYRFPASTMLP